VPWFDVRLGPLHLRVHEAASAVASGQPSLAHGIGNTDVWPDFYLDALWQGFGRVWPVLFLLLVLAIGLLIVRGRTPLHRLLGVALGVGCVGYVFTPYTGGLNFGSGLRFLSPLLLAAFVLLPTHLPNDARWRRGELVASLVLAVVSATMPTDARVPSWPSRWVLPTLAVLGSIGAAGVGVARLRHRDSHRGTMVSTGAALGMLLLLGGWFMQREYLEHRYVNVGLPNDPLDEYFRDVRDARVAVLGTDDTFPMFGLDLSNDVRRGDDPSFDLGADPCVTWRRHLAGYDYVAITRGPVAFGGYPTPDDDVFADPAATEVMRVGANVVYRLRGRLDPATCPAV
jgi:hypothetical protein